MVLCQVSTDLRFRPHNLILYSFFLGPLKPPKKITLNATSSSTVQAKWQPNPSPLVEAYAVRYRRVDLGNAVKIDLVNASNLTVQLSGLKAFTRYGVALHTVTWCKNGSWSKESFVVTDGSGKRLTSD